jgi:hypothetical protein
MFLLPHLFLLISVFLELFSYYSFPFCEMVFVVLLFFLTWDHQVVKMYVFTWQLYHRWTAKLKRVN